MHDVRPIECDRTRHFLSVALDERLTPFERSLVETHVRRCEPCRLYGVRIALVTETLRAAALERLPHPVRLPARTSVAWRSAARAASVGAAAAVAVVAFVGFAAAPDRSAWQDNDALIASALESSAGTNELLIDVVRPIYIAREHQALAFGAGGIGAYKPPLQPGA